MKRFLLCAALALFSVAAAPAAAQSTPNKLAYDDPAIHFQAPAGYLRIYEHAPFTFDEISQLTPVAAWGMPASDPHNQRTITLSMRAFPGGVSLDDWVTSAQNAIRGSIESSLVRILDHTRTPNGMPAALIKVSYGEGFTSSVQYGYEVSDGARGILLTISALVGTMSEDDAKAALKDFSVVLYPVNRR